MVGPQGVTALPGEWLRRDLVARSWCHAALCGGHFAAGGKESEWKALGGERQPGWLAPSKPLVFSRILGNGLLPPFCLTPTSRRAGCLYRTFQAPCEKARVLLGGGGSRPAVQGLGPVCLQQGAPRPRPHFSPSSARKPVSDSSRITYL